jgi:hypothetical protein
LLKSIKMGNDRCLQKISPLAPVRFLFSGWLVSRVFLKRPKHRGKAPPLGAIPLFPLDRISSYFPVYATASKLPPFFNYIRNLICKNLIMRFLF